MFSQDFGIVGDGDDKSWRLAVERRNDRGSRFFPVPSRGAIASYEQGGDRPFHQGLIDFLFIDIRGDDPTRISESSAMETTNRGVSLLSAATIAEAAFSPSRVAELSPVTSRVGKKRL